MGLLDLGIQGGDSLNFRFELMFVVGKTPRFQSRDMVIVCFAELSKGLFSFLFQFFF